MNKEFKEDFCYLSKNPFSLIEFDCDGDGSDENKLLYHKFNVLSVAFERRNKSCSSKINNLSRGQGRILSVLKVKDGFSTKELSELFNISVSSLNESLNKLEQNGYIEKLPSSDDKRILIIRLTEKGKEYKFKESKDIDVFNCLSIEEKRFFDECITKISFELHNRIKEENPEKFNRMKKQREEIFKKYFDDVDFENCFR